MHLLKRALLCSVFLLSAMGCNPDAGSLDSGIGFPATTCPTSEDLSGNHGVESVPDGEKISQSAHINGQVGVTAYLDTLQVFMSTDGLSQVKLEVYKDVSGSPDAGTLVGSSTVSSGLGDTSSDAPLDFDFSSPIPLEVGTEYFFVISATGGSFSISYRDPTPISSGDMSKTKNSQGYWSSPDAPLSAGLSMILYYSHCTGL